jgi:hypothetical protein
MCAHLHASAFVLHLSACKSPAHAVPVDEVCIFSGLFQNSCVCFGCFDYMFETPKLTKQFIIWFHEKKPKIQPIQIEFRFFLVQTENIFSFFDDTLVLIKTKQTKSAKI